MKLFSRLLSFTFLLLLCPSTFGGEESKINLRFVSFPKLKDAKPLHLELDDGKVMNIVLPSVSLSDKYTVSPRDTWKIGKLTADKAGNAIFESYGETKSLNTQNQVVIAIRKGETDQSGLKLVPVDEKEFKPRTCFIINTSKFSISGDIGGNEFHTEPNQSTIIEQGISATKGKREYSHTKFKFNRQNDTKDFYKSTWRNTPTVRTLVIFFNDENATHPQFKVIRDYVSGKSQ